MKKHSRTGRAIRRLFALFLAGCGVFLAAQRDGAFAAVSPPTLGGEVKEGLLRILLDESPQVSRWLDAQSPLKASESPPEDKEEAQEQNLDPATPENIQERTLSGSGEGYLNTAGISLLNRTGKSVDIPAVAAAGTPLHFSAASAGPQVLIMHTHATESFTPAAGEQYTESGVAHTTDETYNMTRVGEEMTRIFTEMGLNVLHDTTYYDYPAYNGAYERSRAGVEAILAQYPTIQMVLDVHRDALVGTDGTIYKPVIQVDGVKTAQVMLLVGTDDAGAAFPDWQEHLALAMEIQQRMNSLWPGLARPITLRTARFNQQLTKGSLLVEVGSHGNTLEEAIAGARLFARAAGQVLTERTEP